MSLDQTLATQPQNDELDLELLDTVVGGASTGMRTTATSSWFSAPTTQHGFNLGSFFSGAWGIIAGNNSRTIAGNNSR